MAADRASETRSAQARRERLADVPTGCPPPTLSATREPLCFGLRMHRGRRRAGTGSHAQVGWSSRCVKRQVEAQHVDARLPEEAEGASFGVARHQPCHARRWQPTGLRHPTYLPRSVLGADVRVETGTLGDGRIGRYRRAAERGDTFFHGVQRRRRGWAELRGGRRGRVVGAARVAAQGQSYGCVAEACASVGQYAGSDAP